MTTPEDRIASVAYRYDDGDEEGRKLTEATVRRLEYRLRHGGKECAACRETKPVAEFGADARERDALRRLCRACRRVQP